MVSLAATSRVIVFGIGTDFPLGIMIINVKCWAIATIQRGSVSEFNAENWWCLDHEKSIEIFESRDCGKLVSSRSFHLLFPWALINPNHPHCIHFLISSHNLSLAGHTSF